MAEGESFCILLLWYCVITCVYGWRVVFRRNTVGVSLLKKDYPIKRRTCVEFFAAVKLYSGGVRVEARAGEARMADGRRDLSKLILELQSEVQQLQNKLGGHEQDEPNDRVTQTTRMTRAARGGILNLAQVRFFLAWLVQISKRKCKRYSEPGFHLSWD